jgi:hypothetical protein
VCQTSTPAVAIAATTATTPAASGMCAMPEPVPASPSAADLTMGQRAETEVSAFLSKRVIAFATVAVLTIVMLGVYRTYPIGLMVNDGPQHLYAGEVFFSNSSESLDRPTKFAEYYSNNRAETSLFYHTIYQALRPYASMEATHDAIVCIYIAAWIVGFFALITIRSFENWPYVVLCCPLVFQWSFFQGTFPFLLTSSILMFALAAYCRLKGQIPKITVLVVAGFVLARGHNFIGLIFVPVVLVVSVSLHSTSLKRLVTEVAAAAIGPLYVMALTRGLDDQADRSAWDRSYDHLSAWRGLFIGDNFSVAGCFILLILGLAISALQAARTKTLPTALSFASLSVLQLLAVYAPFQFMGWQGLRQRFWIVLVILIVAVCPIPRIRRKTIAVYFALVLFSIYAVTVQISVLKNIYIKYMPIIAAIDSFKVDIKGSPSLSFLPAARRTTELETSIPHFTPEIHLNAYAAAKLGVIAFNTHSTNSRIHHIIKMNPFFPSMRIPGRHFDPWFELWQSPDLASRPAILRMESLRFSTIGSLLVTDATDDDLVAIKEVGFRELDKTEHATILRFDGCAAFSLSSLTATYSLDANSVIDTNIPTDSMVPVPCGPFFRLDDL